MNVSEPYPDSPDKGNLMCTGELLPIASPRYEFGPPGFKAIELGRLVDRAIRESGMIEFKKLVITPGEKVWTIYVDIYPLNDDGNLLDAATIATVLALKNAKMPLLNEDGSIDYDKRKDSLPLSKETNPLSFSFFKLGDAIVLDPTREEEEACDSRVTWGMSKWNGEYMINSCQKIGAEVFSGEEIEKMMEILPKKYEEMSRKIKSLH